MHLDELAALLLPMSGCRIRRKGGRRTLAFRRGKDLRQKRGKYGLKPDFQLYFFSLFFHLERLYPPPVRGHAGESADPAQEVLRQAAGVGLAQQKGDLFKKKSVSYDHVATWILRIDIQS